MHLLYPRSKMVIPNAKDWISWSTNFLQPTVLNTRRPQLIPLKFQTTNLKKQYRLKKNTQSWWQWAHTNRESLILVGSICALILILYIRWTDRQSKKKKKVTPYYYLPPVVSAVAPPVQPFPFNKSSNN